MYESLPAVVVAGPHGPEAVGSSPELLLTLLGIYEDLVRQQRPDIDEHLRPGIGRRQIADQLADIGIQPPDELVVLYSWRDGNASTFGGGPLPAFPFHSLERAIADYKSLADLVSATPDAEEARGLTWGAELGWLSVTAGNSGLAIDCRSHTGEPPQVRKTDAAFFDDEGLFRCSSLCTIVTWWIEGLRAGAYTRANGDWSVQSQLLPRLQIASGFA